MKKRIIMIFFTILVLSLSIFVTMTLTNRTFFKDYYEVINLEDKKVKISLPLFSYFEKKDEMGTATFKTIRRVSAVQDSLNSYVEYLQTCYDESYFYDADLDITIKRYQVENGFPFNKIYLSYEHGNYCENEFVLDANWMSNIIDNALIEEANIKKCTVKNDNISCDSKAIGVIDINELFNYASQDTIIRIDNRNNISYQSNEDYYLIDVYYSLNNNTYLMEIFNHNDNYLAFKVINSNDHPQNAIYYIDINPNQLFSNIYDNY